MKTYRYANLLAILIVFLAGSVSIADQTRAFFVVPATETGDYPTVSPSSSNSTLAKIQPIEQVTIPAITTNPQITAARTVSAATRSATTCNGYYGYITIGGRNICLASTDTTNGSLSYNHAYIFNGAISSNQFIFGHNSSNIFGNLASLPNGTIFSVTLSGQTTTYRISFKETVCDYTNGQQHGARYDCANYPEPVLNMNHAVMPYLRGANLAIMTCAGAPLGQGDATHRLVVYANKV